MEQPTEKTEKATILIVDDERGPRESLRDRPYRRALDREVVISEIRRFAGVQFDPDIAKKFVTILETGVCEVDPELLADAVQDSTTGPRMPAMPETNA
jgi:response regulator RpfG family c-di-GMP phosphodiesterase